MPIADTKSERIEVRATRSQKALLQRAAGAAHKTVAGFLLEAGMSAAEQALLDRRLFRLEEAQWRAFQEALERPAVGKPRLARLLAEQSVLE